MSTVNIPEFEFVIDLQGESLYTKWLELGNVGEWADFLDWLRIKGDTGDSAYEVWLALGYEGTQADFMTFLQNPAYEAGVTAVEAMQIAVLAKDTAVEAENTAVLAKDVAVQKAIDAGTSEQNAAGSALAAKASEDAAKLSENTAGQSAIEAADSKTAAEAAQTAATEQAGIANTKAQEASTSAQNAATSEQNALTSKNAAKASEDAAKLSETNAGNSATAAGQAKTAAETAKGLAEAARDAAALSKTAAETAENNAELAQAAAELAKTGAETARDTALNTVNDVRETGEKNSVAIATLENTINSANINQETTATVTGVDTVALPKTAANTGMQVQLFGQSAENLVVNGDFRNGTTGWTTPTPPENYFSVVDGILNNTTNAGYTSSIVQNAIQNVNVNDKFYVTSFVKGNSDSTAIQFYIRGGASVSGALIINTGLTSWQKFSGILTIATKTTGTVYVALRPYQASNTGGFVTSIDNVMAINLTATFGAGNEPTKEQCDVLFANYFEGSDNVLGTGRVRSVGKNLFDKTKFIDNQRYFFETGDPTVDATFFSTGYIRCLPNTAYSHNRGAGSVWVVYDSNFNKIGYSSDTPQTYTTPNDSRVTYLRVATAKTANTVDNYMVTKSSTVPTVYEPFNPSSLYLTTPELRSNGLIKDEIRKGANGYELVKRVGVGTLGGELVTNGGFESGLTGFTFQNDIGGATANFTLNTTNPISGIQDGLVNISVAGTSSIRPLILFNTTPRTIGKTYTLEVSFKGVSGSPKLDSIFINGGIGAIIFSEIFAVGVVKTIKHTFIPTLDNSTGIQIQFDGRSSGAVQIDNITIKELIYSDGAATGTGLTKFGSNIHYTLATPTITPIAHAGLLNSNSNGTAYFEPIIADAGVYGSDIAIQLTDYTISSLERIVKRVNGSDVELSTATAVIAGNGLSFTHPNLASGDLVMFTYAYNRESIGRSMTLTHFDSRFVVKDTANANVYRITPKITNGVLTWTLTLV